MLPCSSKEQELALRGPASVLRVPASIWPKSALEHVQEVNYGDRINSMKPQDKIKRWKTEWKNFNDSIPSSLASLLKQLVPSQFQLLILETLQMGLLIRG